VAATPPILALHHPRLSWTVYIPLVPQRGIENLLTLGKSDGSLVAQAISLGSRSGRSHGVENEPLAMVIDAGASQDVRHLDAQLVAGPTVSRYRRPPFQAEDDRWSGSSRDPGSISVISYPISLRASHLLLVPSPARPNAGHPDELDLATVSDVPGGRCLFVSVDQPAVDACSLGVGGEGTVLDTSCFHLVAGSSVDSERTSSP